MTHRSQTSFYKSNGTSLVKADELLWVTYAPLLLMNHCNYSCSILPEYNSIHFAKYIT